MAIHMPCGDGFESMIPCTGIPRGDLPGFWVLTKYDDVRAVYRDPATFSSAGGILLRPEIYGGDPGGGRTLALTDPPHHRKLRALVDDWFAPRSIRALDAQMRDIAHDVVTRALEREVCDFVAEIGARMPLYVICEMMGVPRDDWEHLFTLTNDAFGAADAMDRRAAHLDILQYFEELATTRAKSPTDDLVSLLATAKIDGRKLTADEIMLNCDNLLVGGTENSQNRGLRRNARVPSAPGSVARAVDGAGTAPLRGRGGASLDVNRYAYHAHRDRAGNHARSTDRSRTAGHAMEPVS